MVGENRCGVRIRKCFTAIVDLAVFQYSLPILKIYSIRYVKKISKKLKKKNFDKNFETALLLKFNKYV